MLKIESSRTRQWVTTGLLMVIIVSVGFSVLALLGPQVKNMSATAVDGNSLNDSQCGLSQMLYRDDGYGGDVASAAIVPPAPAAVTASVAPAEMSRRVEYGASTALLVDDVRESFTRLSELVARHRGYMVTSRFTQSVKDAGPEAMYRVKIPTAEFDSFLGEVRALGEILAENIQSDDRTEAYRDLEAGVRERDRTLALLRDKLTTAETPRVATELDRVQTDRDRMETARMQLEIKTDYMTIEVSLRETETGAAVGARLACFDGFRGKMSAALGTASNLSADGLALIVIGTGACLPWLGLGYVIWLGTRRYHKHLKTVALGEEEKVVTL